MRDVAIPQDRDQRAGARGDARLEWWRAAKFGMPVRGTAHLLAGPSQTPPVVVSEGETTLIKGPVAAPDAADTVIAIAKPSIIR